MLVVELLEYRPNDEPSSQDSRTTDQAVVQKPEFDSVTNKAGV